MTKRDFELVASAIADVEASTELFDVDGIGASTLRLVVDALSGRMKEQNPRFDAGRFEAAALPRQSERMKQAILKALERSGR